MPSEDVFVVFQWWSAVFLIGVVAFPITKRLFAKWFDHGYLFAKAVGFAVVAYIIYVVGSLRILPFTQWTVYGSLVLCFLLGMVPHVLRRPPVASRTRVQGPIWTTITTWWETVFWEKGIIFFAEELFFFLLLLYWTWVKAHEPSVRGLEKFMDYGFMQSILNTRYFPAPDMWWAGGSINYYYFGHLVTAVVTKLSGLSLGYTFNLMLATLFALTASMGFSIAYQLLGMGKTPKRPYIRIIGGALTAFLVSLAGNMQTLYAFTKGYTGEDVKPFWELLWPIGTFFRTVGTGLETYWYANATRFIPFSIHEFPSYSFVVSDVHGHVLSLPFVLLAIALLIVIFGLHPLDAIRHRSKTWWTTIIFYGWLLGILLMTNALDGPIYGLLFAALWFILILWPGRMRIKTDWFDLLYPVFLVAILAFVSALPFLFFFSSFAGGIGVNCPPSFLQNMKFGPIIFESADKCQRSPLWMMWLLWGFFWFTGIGLFIAKLWKKEDQSRPFIRILKVFFLFSVGLIIFPEFLYVKDIYPAHFRSNTMFKLGYQAYIMWSIISGFVIMHFVTDSAARRQKILRGVFFVLLAPQLFLVSIYPIFSVRSYFDGLKNYRGIWGLSWITQEYTPYWDAITWLQSQIPQTGNLPVIAEAAGDSYTDYNMVSAFTGLPTITGWAVHEWLWRGSYDIVAPRQDDVRTIYESSNPEDIAAVLARYHVRYIIKGFQEWEQYRAPEVEPLDQLGTRAFTSGDLVIWDVGKR